MKRPLTFLLLVVATLTSSADVKLPAIFSEHMVLQQKHNNPVWGWADPGEKITVLIGQQNKTTTADKDGNWRVTLDPLPAGGPHKMVVKGKSILTFNDVLVGEVWLCSGGSNMKFAAQNANNAHIEGLTAKFPNLRIITIPNVGTQEAQQDFEGKWEAINFESVRMFSAVGYFFGRILHQSLDVPVGLINNSWSGSSAEAWVRRDVLAADQRYQELLAQWEQTEKTFDHEKVMSDYQAERARWLESVEEAKAATKPRPRGPRHPYNPLTGSQRPGNLYNGCLKPIIGYGIQGVIWYQGESNASRAEQYGHLFPLMISHWRDEWQQGDFSFYWVQLADYHAELANPANSEWAELREAQTKTQKLPNTGQAVITDIGEGHNIHPQDKQTVGSRLARIALAKNYGIKIVHRSPEFRSVRFEGNQATIKFDHVHKGLSAIDTIELRGFAVAAQDRLFHWAKAIIVGPDTVIVSSEAVREPVAVRYNWADNPLGNLITRDPLPATSFRTDNWPANTTNIPRTSPPRVTKGPNVRSTTSTDIPTTNNLEVESATFQGGKAIIKFKHVNKGLKAADALGIRGFTIAGADGRFHWAKATIVSSDTVIVFSKAVEKPVTARYNPQSGNLITEN